MADHIATLTLMMARARIMQRALKREERLLNRRPRGRPLTLVEGWPFITFLNLYLANIHVLVETWDEYYFHDEAVYRLLRAGYRGRLKRFRNAVFHAGPYNDKRIVAVYGRHDEIRGWADELLQAVATFVKRELAARRAARMRASV